MFHNSNPVIRSVKTDTLISTDQVTYLGVAMRTLFLIGLAVISAFLTIYYLPALGTEVFIGVLIAAVIIGFISVIVGTRSVRLAPIFASIYALSEGVVLGFLSGMYASLFEGIVPTAIMTTVIVLLVMLLLYSTGIIKVTSRFASILVVTLISVIIMSIVPMIFTKLLYSGFYFLICGISAVLSALFLLLDFESIKTCVEMGTDVKYGWVLSLGLMVTLVWIYIEILRLLAIFARNRK
jgi:uncharacterized YccA/Bax inhibitor family protein